MTAVIIAESWVGVGSRKVEKLKLALAKAREEVETTIGIPKSRLLTRVNNIWILRFNKAAVKTASMAAETPQYAVLVGTVFSAEDVEQIKAADDIKPTYAAMLKHASKSNPKHVTDSPRPRITAATQTPVCINRKRGSFISFKGEG